MADVTAAASPVTLDGKEYMMSPLDDRDIEELNNWLRSTYIEMARRSLSPEMTREQRDEILDSAMRTARRASWMSPDAKAVMASLEGVSRVMWQGLKKRHPELSHADVRRMIKDQIIDIDVLNKTFRELNTGAKVDAVGEGKKRRRSRARRSTHS